MKNFYLVWRHCLLMVLGCFICLSGFAQLTSLEPGKVYRFVNRMYPGYSMTAGSMTTAIGAATVESSKSQLWYVAPDFITFVRHHIAQNENQRVT